MVRKLNPTPSDERMLTDAELDIMHVLWQHGPLTTAQVKEHHPLGESMAFTTVSTMLRVLSQKDFISAEKQGRGFLYRASLAKQEYQSRTVANVVDRVFDGAPSELVKQLLNKDKLSAKERAELIDLLK